MRRLVALCALGPLVLAACVGPARTFDAYEGKAAASADAARAAVETARLAASAAADGDAFAPTLSVIIAEAEDGASSVQGQFGSIQPPDARSDDLRKELDDLLSRAVETLSRMRIAVRRGEIDTLNALSRPLAPISEALDAFATRHAL